jgi:hypothetical protein
MKPPESILFLGVFWSFSEEIKINYTYLPLTLNPLSGSSDFSDISPKYPLFTKMTSELVM